MITRCVGFTRTAMRFTLAACLMLPASASGAPPELRTSRSRSTGLVSFVTSADGDAITINAPAAGHVADALQFFREYGSLFGISDADRQLQFENAQTDWLGHAHTTYRQVHDGVRVFGGVLKVHQWADGAIYAANGDYYPISKKLNMQTQVSEAQSQTSAMAVLEAPNAEVSHSELVIVNPGWYGDPDIGAHLAYYIIISDAQAGLHEAFFVDAQSGEILDRWNLTDHAEDREIHDAGGTNEIPGPLARSEGDPPTGEPEVDAAYDYYGDVYDYYFQGQQRDSIDGAGLTMVATVNYDSGGYCPNASWSSTLLQMRFCTGTVTDDIVGHELTHGVTQFTAGLIYQHQPGQLNESYSDIFGELIDLFNGDAAFAGPPSGPPFWPLHPTGPGLDTPNDVRTACSPAPEYVDGVRWLVGEDAAAFGGAIRDMWDPTCEGDPDSANSELQTCPAGDNGGVHSGSGVPNHAFAMVTDGKSFNGYDVAGIGPIKSAAVWYRALTTYLTPLSDFEDAYAALNQAASDLVGNEPYDPRTGMPSGETFTAFDAQQVDEALQAVEMNTPGACGQGSAVLSSVPAEFCIERTTVFADNFESGAAGWTVTNSNPPTAYDWELTTEELPFARPGIAWFAADPDIGNCSAQDEAGLHSLISPEIELPNTDDVFMISFTHYLATEGAWDGGNISVSVNGNAWQLVPREAFDFNPYNGQLRGETNPIAGQVAWTGGGGEWGTSIVNLSSFVSGGQNLRVRFDLGKDGCTGLEGWYVDDFEIMTCPDCDTDGTSDQREFRVVFASEPLGPVGDGSEVSYTITGAPVADGDVTIDLTAYADVGAADEFLEVDINGTFVGNVLETGAGDCPYTPDANEELIVSAEIFNDAVDGGDAVITLSATPEVNPDLCGGLPYVTLVVTYPLGTDDINNNGTPDTCECIGDVNQDGEVDITDLLTLLAAWGDCVDCPSDLDADGTVAISDLLILLSAWGLCN